MPCARLWAVTTEPGEVAQVEVVGILFREYFVGRFSVGGNGPWGSDPFRIQTRWTLARVKVSLRPARFTVEVTNRGGVGSLALGDGGSWSYHEVRHAEVFESPAWARRRGLSRDEFPIGVRLHFGESRTALLIFTDQPDVLLDALESHLVEVGRTPIKLSPMLFGRK